MVILNISDVSNPTVVSHIDYAAPFPGFTHTMLPLFSRDLTMVAQEAVWTNWEDYPKLVCVMDIRDETRTIISSFPMADTNNILRYIQCMKPRILYHINRRTGGDVENIDVHDLPEEEAQMIAAFVEFLRRRRSQQPEGEEEPQETRETRPGLPPVEAAFAAWPLGVKGTLTREDIYDHL